MRTPLLSVFDDAVRSTFESTLQDMLGSAVRGEVEHIPHKKGVSMSDASDRFDDLVVVLMEAFGHSARVIVHKMMLRLYDAYSQRVDFSYQDQLKGKMVLLRQRILSDHLRPKGVSYDSDNFDEKTESNDDETSAQTGKAAWSSFYRLKKGVGSGSTQN
ncbi:hypothetical protein AUG19_08365 [archaeon 13_1_20CM_2_54_9]|nr:MAG: hypothetical protein AUJ07_10465 [Crenarchaeota archaeon 13_1_40CM_3_53_5]OLE74575.1 MAG: hypothetical protein AUG19_08365 [archaeon 13_1_20CM_2_54_9]